MRQEQKDSPESFIGVAADHHRHISELSGLEKLLGRVVEEVSVDRRHEREEVELVVGDARLELDDLDAGLSPEAVQRRRDVAGVEVAADVRDQLFWNRMRRQ